MTHYPSHPARPRASALPCRGFTLIEMVVVMAIIGILVALLLPAVQRGREAANCVACRNNLKQIGLAMHGFHDANGYLPPGMVTGLNIQDSYHTGFTYMLPYLEQDPIHRLYDYDVPWYDQANYQAVGQEVKIFYCPSNRTHGSIDLTPLIAQWGGSAMPPTVGSCDYVLCKGANAGLYNDPSAIPTAARGLFNVTQASSSTVKLQWAPTPSFRVRLTDIGDGLSLTFAAGEAAGGTSAYVAADLNDPTQAAIDPFQNGPVVLDQAWAAASLGDPSHPWYPGLFGVTAQFGLSPNPQDEPMNRRPGTPTVVGGDHSGYNLTGRDRVSGFRSMHTLGCNFLYADCSVRWVNEGIAPAIYRALSTYAGNEPLAGADGQ